MNLPHDRSKAVSPSSVKPLLEMTKQEKTTFWTMNIMTAFPGIVVLVLLAYVASTLKPLQKPWENPGYQTFVWMMAGLFLLTALIPGAVVFRLILRRVRTGSYLPVGTELERLRARPKRPRSLRRRVLILYFAEAFLFALNAMHHTHGRTLGWLGGGLLALAIVVSLVEIVQPAGLNDRRARAPRREGFACPSCGQSPPNGKWWSCNQCKKAFDTFATSATCPNCGAWFSTTSCGNCKASHSMSQWAAAANARAGALSEQPR